MTQADRVHSTPPLDTSATLSRRRFLVHFALATAAIAVPAVAVAVPETDPIFAVIETHRAAVLAHKEAVRVEFAYEENARVRA